MRRQIVLAWIVVALAFGVLALGSDEESGVEETLAERAARIHSESIICDLHADTITKIHLKKLDFFIGNKALQIDLPKLRKGNIALTSQAVWVLNKGLKTSPHTYVSDALDTFDFMLEQSKDDMALARGYKEFIQARKQGKIAVVLTIEDGRAIEADIDRLHELYGRGVRGMSLTWNLNNKLATSAWEARHRKGQGLTEKGREVIREMAKMGMMIDISHLSTQTVRDILEEVDVPIYASHSCAWQLNPHWRNLRDWQIKAIAERGGVIGVNFYNVHLRRDAKRASVRDVGRHIDYIVKIGGIDVAAVGSDFDGDIGSPRGIENISKMQALTEELLRRGYSEEDVKKIMGLNFLRYFKSICPQ